MKVNLRKIRTQKPAHPPVPALEWIRDVSGRAARATAVGSRRLLIENHRGILDFTDECVRLSTTNGPLCVHGSGLTLCEVRRASLIVQGCIQQVDLPPERGVQ